MNKDSIQLRKLKFVALEAFTKGKGSNVMTKKDFEFLENLTSNVEIVDDVVINY